MVPRCHMQVSCQCFIERMRLYCKEEFRLFENSDSIRVFQNENLFWMQNNDFTHD